MINALPTKEFVFNPRSRYTTLEIVDGTPQHVLDSSSFSAQTKKDTFKSIGLIAQTLQTYLNDNSIDAGNFVDDSNSDELGIRTENLTFVLWKAVQELSAKNDALVARITALENS